MDPQDREGVTQDVGTDRTGDRRRVGDALDDALNRSCGEVDRLAEDEVVLEESPHTVRERDDSKLGLLSERPTLPDLVDPQGRIDTRFADDARPRSPVDDRDLPEHEP